MVRLIVALFFVLCVAVFAVINVRPTPIHYIFGVTSVPLVLIILGAACLGGLSVGLLGAVSQLKWRRERKRLEQYIRELEANAPISDEPTVVPEAVGSIPQEDVEAPQSEQQPEKG